MKLRPRYSLLTLLILTAIVAGGVKWWRRPHHVVEPLSETVECEYTYTRDWWGKKQILGPRVVRRKDAGGRLVTARIGYYRHGQFVSSSICVISPGFERLWDSEEMKSIRNLTVAENQEYEQAITWEKAKFAKQGNDHVGNVWETSGPDFPQ